MVPGAGIEPARCFHRGILSPLRLPISPSGHFEGMVLLGFCWNGGWSRNRTGVNGVAVRCMTTLPSSLYSSHAYQKPAHYTKTCDFEHGLSVKKSKLFYHWFVCFSRPSEWPPCHPALIHLMPCKWSRNKPKLEALGVDGMLTDLEDVLWFR